MPLVSIMPFLKSLVSLIEVSHCRIWVTSESYSDGLFAAARITIGRVKRHLYLPNVTAKPSQIECAQSRCKQLFTDFIKDKLGALAQKLGVND